jgi:hypothetical protein
MWRGSATGLFSPSAHGGDDGFQGLSGGGKGIFHFWGDLGVHLSTDKAIALELAELAGEHSGRDGREQPLKLGEAAETRIEVIEDQDLPSAANEDQRAFGRTSDFGLPHDAVK